LLTTFVFLPFSSKTLLSITIFCFFWGLFYGFLNNIFPILLKIILPASLLGFLLAETFLIILILIILNNGSKEEQR